MIAWYPSIPIGTVSAESTRVLGVIPPESTGILVKGMDVYLATAQAIGHTDYWILELGALYAPGGFEVRGKIAAPKTGLSVGRNAVEFLAKVRYTTGEVVAIRARPIGSPVALTGCDVVLRIQEP